MTLPLYQPRRELKDWLLNQVEARAQVFRGDHEGEIVLSNGLISRRFRIQQDGAATVGIDNQMTGEAMLRAVRPEATFRIDGKEVEVGGFTGQPDLAFLRADWLDQMRPTPSPLRFDGYDLAQPEQRMPWVRHRHAPDAAWPPKGAGLVLHFVGGGLKADVHYELYDGIPLLAKWVRLENETGKETTVEKFTGEILSLVEAESVVDPTNSWRHPAIAVATDYSFGGQIKGVYWEEEPDYKTQVNYELKTPCRLETRPPLGPNVMLKPGEKFETFRTFELYHDSTDLERQGLGVRRMYRTIAPWTQENPLMLHLTSTDPATVHRAIDQAADCGFEMIVISFWSGLDMEDVSPANIAKIKEFRAYANSKGVELGGYSLLASRSIDKANDIVNPKPIFGNSPCLGSKWGEEYFAKIKKFITETGFNLLEHDGSYPGDPCASTVHPGHKGLEDSQWMQFQEIASFYRWCREHDVFLNVPDVYFLSGSNKTAMGYRESNWSLPRDQQHIHARQNLYDGTWEKTPSMGWMMVPLVEYQGGGAPATIEPLKDHLADYSLHLANNLGYGAQACYRGPRLYDSPETRTVVKKWVDWFKAHREILESDVIHVRRADGINLDAVLHVSPKGKTKAMAVVYNPSDKELSQEVVLPLYFSGLSKSCRMSQEDGKETLARLDDKARLVITVKVAPRSCTWFTFR